MILNEVIFKSKSEEGKIYFNHVSTTRTQKSIEKISTLITEKIAKELNEKCNVKIVDNTKKQTKKEN